MQRAIFTEKQERVKFITTNEGIFVFICLNESRNTNINGDIYYEYDYNDFPLPKNLTKDIINNSPEEYLDFPKTSLSLEERIFELEKKNKLLEDCILELSSILYK